MHLVSPTDTRSAASSAALTAVKNSDTTGSGTGGQLTWTYSVAAADVEYLAAGQTKVESFTITLDDQNGGARHPPDRRDDHRHQRRAGGHRAGSRRRDHRAGRHPPATSPTAARIAFTDVDLTDVHLVSPTGTAIGSVLGTLTAVKNTDTTGSGTGGQLTWNYSVAAAAVEYLAAGQTKVESFTITLDDQNGGLITRQIDVTITGTNDAPVVTVQDLVGAVTELATPTGNLTDSGTIAFGDVDLTDVHLVSATGTAGRQRAGHPHRRQEHRHHRQRHRRPADLELPRRRVGRRVPGCRPDQGRELHHHARRPERRPGDAPDRRHDHRHQRRADRHGAGPDRRRDGGGDAVWQPDRQRHDRLRRRRPGRRAPGLGQRNTPSAASSARSPR